MKSHWQVRKNRESAIVFLNGWGMDQHPFSAISSDDSDVLILFDYRDLQLPNDLFTVLNNYEQVDLVSWSMGVWVGQQVFAEHIDTFRLKIAVNGTLKPIDDCFGIPNEIYNRTLDNYSSNGQDRFYRRMSREKGVLEIFRSMKPEREISDQKEELESIKKAVKVTEYSGSIYSHIVISSEDLVVLTANQKAFWKSSNTIIVDGCHFPFTRWKKWDELLDMVITNG